MVGDEDGVLFIRPQDAGKIADATLAVERKEADIMETYYRDGGHIRPFCKMRKFSRDWMRDSRIVKGKFNTM